MFIEDFPTTNGFIFSVKGCKTYPAQPYDDNTLDYITVSKCGDKYIMGLTHAVFKESVKEDENPHSKDHTCELLAYINLSDKEMLEFNKKLNELMLK